MGAGMIFLKGFMGVPEDANLTFTVIEVGVDGDVGHTLHQIQIDGEALDFERSENGEEWVYVDGQWWNEPEDWKDGCTWLADLNDAIKEVPAEVAGVVKEATPTFSKILPRHPPLFPDSGQSLGDSPTMRVLLGDVDGDGDLDALTSSDDEEPNKIWLNDGSGIFHDSGESLGIPKDRYFASEDPLGDLDGDGDLDVLVKARYDPNAVSNRIEIWLNDGSGTFYDSGESFGDLEYSNSSVLGDLDGDGDLDAWVSSIQIVKVAGYNAYRHERTLQSVWLNDGSGTFTDSGQTFGESNTNDVALGDLDGDGDLDVFLSHYEGPPNQVWINDGSGSFTDGGQSLGYSGTLMSPIANVALGDFDGDGDLDALVEDTITMERGPIRKVWINDGSGSFTDSGQSITDIDSGMLMVGDLDGDGDLDVFVARQNPPSGNKIWLNDGHGVFTDSEQSLGDSDTFTVALGDLDGDGDLDVFLGNAVRDRSNGKTGFVGSPDRVLFNNSLHE
tara:strand:- start:184 stop:1689 length:1506 start_codon:yes stop_codon:yes gene_type:complete